MNDNPQTPEEVAAWLAAHGGPAGGEGPDADGRIVQRAADGSYLVQQALPGGSTRVLEVKPAATGVSAVATDQPATAAPAPSGGGMNQQQVEAWIAAQGGPGSVQHSSEKKRIANPAFSLTLPDGTPNPQYQPGQPATIETASEMWINSKTGAKLHVSRKDDGSFDVIENQGADPNKPAAAATTEVSKAAEAKAKREREESERNAALPADQDPRYETDAVRATRAQDTIKQQGADAKAADDKKRQDAAAAAATAERNRPVVTTIPINGQRYTQTVTPDPNGGVPTITFQGPDGTPIPQLPAEIKPGQVIKGGGANGEDVQAVAGADGRISYQPIAGAPSTPQLPADLPRFTPDPHRPGYGLDEFTAQLREYKRTHPTLTDAQITQIVTDAHASAKAEESRLTNQATIAQNAQNAAISQRGQDISRQNQLGSLATSAFGTATESGNKLLGAIAPGQWAGNVTTPAMGPWAANMAATGGFGLPGQVPVPPVLQAMQQWGQPPAVAPVAVPAVPVAPPVASGVAPIFAPQPVAPPPAAPTGPNPATPNLYPPGSPVNPPAGQPGNNPNAPVGMTLPAMRGFGMPAFDRNAWLQQQLSLTDDPLDAEILRQVAGVSA